MPAALGFFKLLNQKSFFSLVAYLSFQHRINSALISEDPDISKIRVGIPAEYFCEDMSEEVLEAWSQVADLLEDNGIRVYPGNNSIKLKVNYKCYGKEL